MAENWEVSVKAAAQKLADALQDATTLNVITEYVVPATVGAQQEAPVRLETTIKLDQDSTNQVAARRLADGTITVDMPLYDIHEKNVKAAIDYRERVLAALLDAVKAQLR